MGAAAFLAADAGMAWAATGLMLAVLVAYEVALWPRSRRSPARLARTAHAALREQWFDVVSRQPGSEILAVQTLRNSVMSATLTASTAVLGLMGSVTLALPTLRGRLAGVPELDARLLLELLLMALLFAALMASAVAVRYYTHAGFVAGMPVGSPERAAWSVAGADYVRRAGVLYGWGLRQLLLIAPLLAALLHPFAGLPVALLTVTALSAFDRFALEAPSAPPAA
jgi:hypothetical protein